MNTIQQMIYNQDTLENKDVKKLVVALAMSYNIFASM